MARKSEAQSAKGATERRVITPRFVVRVVLWGVLLVGAIYGWHRLELFLIRDARFMVALPDYGPESPSLQVNGLQYASRTQVLQVFAPDYGRSLYLLPLKQRRDQLRAIDWVKDASISRLWPNRIVVHLVEREPVAFMNVPADRQGLMRTMLIDGEGTVLTPPGQAHFRLPVVVGLPSNASSDDRRRRVARLTVLMRDIGKEDGRVSEVDVSNTENLRITVRADQRAMVLWMGDHNFGTRFQGFLTHLPKITERVPNAHTLDLRLDDRITVVEDDKR